MRFPTWKEVESDPEFQSLEPTKKKEYFGKWSKTAVDRAMQQGLYRDNDFASGFTGWYNQKAKEYGEEEEFGDFQQLSTRLRQPPKVGTSILGEITQIPSAFKSAIDQPLEAFGETAEVLGAPALAQTLKGAVEAPKDYKTAAESFMRPEKGEFEVAGFAPQYLPRAIVEQAGQLAGAVATRAIGAKVGALLGPAGIAVGAFTGPAVFEMAQIVGPVAKERAKNNGRTEPNNEDLAWAWTTAGTSGALNAIGAKYIPGGEKLVGGISKKIAASILGEGLTESGQALAQQTGETILTEKGLTVSPKEAIAEGIIGGAAGGVATAIFERADKKPEDPTKAAATKAAADQLAEANKTALELSANSAPITAKVIQDQAAKDFSAIAETEEAVEEVERFAPPEDAITKQELKTQYAALSPEDLTDTEATFRERLDDDDPEMRTFAQNALDAIAEVRAEQARARKLPTDVLPTETPGATYGREADIYDVFAGIRRKPMPPSGPAFESAQVIEEAARRADILRRTPEGRDLLRRELQGEEMVGGVRRATEEALATAPEPAEGDVFAGIRRPSRAEEAAITIEQQLTEDERIRRSQLGAEALREELAQAESLSRVADNTATDEEVVRLARQGLVNIQEGQNIITPRGEEVMQRGGAPLPRLTPEERAAEVAAAPAPAAIVEQAPPVIEAPAVTPAPAAERVVPITEPTEAVEDIEAGAPPLSTENLYFENNLAQRAWRIAAGFKYDKERGDWFHPSYPDLSRGNAEQEINDTNPPTQTQVRAVLDQLRQKYTPAIKEVAPTEVATFQKGDMVRVPNRVPVYEKGEVVGGRTVMVGGSVTRVMPDGKVEVRLQQGGYATLLPAQIEMRKKAPTPVTTPTVTEAVTPAPAVQEIISPAKSRKSLEGAAAPSISSLSDGEVVALAEIVSGKTKQDIFTKETRDAIKPFLNSISKEDAKFATSLPLKYIPNKVREIILAAQAEPVAEPAGISVGNRIKLGKSPQTYTVEEVIPQSETERGLGEQFYSVKNERTGEVQTVEANDIRVVRGKGMRKLFAGEKAEMPQFRRDSLDAARAMAATGKTPEEIRAVTGWFQGMDGKMRWEIPDQDARLITPQVKNRLQRATDWLHSQGVPTNLDVGSPRVDAELRKQALDFADQNVPQFRLGDILQHESLYAAYPEARNIPIEFQTSPEYAGMYEPARGIISIGEGIITDKSDAKLSTLLHEIQHWIQQTETFAKGGSPNPALSGIAFDSKKKKAFERIYNNLLKAAFKPLSLEEYSRQAWGMEKPNAEVKKDYQQYLKSQKKPSTFIVNEIQKDAFRQLYRNLAGEIEARDVQARKDFTQEQRDAIAPYSSENISEAVVSMSSADMAAEIRVEEKVQPVPEADRYTFKEAANRSIRFFGGTAPENFVIVNDSQNKDYEMKAGYDPDSGEIILNRAYIRKGENIEDILTHELGHYIYSDPQFQKAFQNFLESMPDDARAEIDDIVNEGYNKETNEVQIEERQVIAFASLVRKTKRGRTAWEKVKDVIKTIINRLLKTNIVLSDHGAMAVFNVGYKRFNSGERIIREMKKGTLRTAPEGMTKMDRDYLVAVERGDMETAQRMVDEAAKRAGYTVDGWHRTDADFTIFKPSPDSQMIYFGLDEKGVDAFLERYAGRKVKAYLRSAKPLNTKDTPIPYREADRNRPLANTDYDSVFVRDETGLSIAVKDPSQIKSADPVTYDDAGDVIPLSQRFRPTSPDIRRMAPTPAPEAAVEEAPAERPKRRTKMQNIIDISTGVKRPKTKLTVNEMTALKDQIKMRARRRREDKRSQREFAEELTKEIREMTIRGKVRPAQLRAIMSVALRTQFDNEASINAFNKYADKVIENANYEKDISDALSTIKRAKQLSKGKKGSSRIRHRLAELARFNPRDIEPESMEPKRVEIDGEIVLEKPISVAEYTAVLKEYMGSLGPVTAEGFRVIPEAEIVDFLERMAAQYDANVEERRKAAFAKKLQQALENKALLPSELESITKDSPEEYEQNLKKKQEDKRLKIENAITDLAMDAQSALVTYQPPEMTADKKEVLDFMRAVNVGDIPAGERKEFVLIANNILVNNDFSGSKKFTSIAKGQIGAMKAAEDAKSVKRNNAMLTFLDGYISEKLTRAINLSIQSIADTFRNIAGKEGAPRLLFLMGMGDLARGQATANKLNDEIANGIRDRYTQIEEETGQQISDKQGMFSMGVAGTLIQIQPDETEAEGISRIRKLILENIAVMENSPLLEDRRNVQFVKKALAEVDADSVDGILENLNRLHPANYKALDFLMNTVLPEQKETLKEHDELFNNQTDNYNNPFYLPIRYRRTMVPVRTPEDIITSIYGGTPTPKQAANTIKRQKYSTLPRDVDGAPMLFDFNLTKNVLDSLSSQITAAYTNPYWQQIVSFLKAPPASDAVGGTRNLSFVNERLGKLAQSRTRRAYEMDGVSRILDTVANVSRRLGIGLALGGYGQFIKQLPDQLMTTLINVKDPQLMSDSMADLLSGRANAVLRQFSIGERGEIAGGTTWTNQMEGNFDKVRRFINDGNWVKAADAFERFNNVWLFALKKSDYLAAGSGWLAYYRKYLRDRGEEFNNWDEEAALLQEDNQLRIEAALYAEQMVDMYQGSSDPTKMATLSQRGQNGWENLAKTIFIPFFSFVIQQRSRIFSDARDVAFGDSDQKKSGASGLAGTLLGILAFHSARRFALPALAGVGASAVYALLGVDMDEPDEEKQKEEANRIWRQFSGEVLSNIFFGGFGDFTEKKFIDSVNYASYLIEVQIGNENVLNDKGELISFDKYQKERSPLYRYTGPGSENNLGMLDIMPGQIGELKKRIEEMTSEELAESLTPEERRVLFVAGLSEWLYTMRLNDADIARMIRRMNKDVIEQAEEREKARKRLQEIYQ